MEDEHLGPISDQTSAIKAVLGLAIRSEDAPITKVPREVLHPPGLGPIAVFNLEYGLMKSTIADLALQSRPDPNCILGNRVTPASNGRANQVFSTGLPYLDLLLGGGHALGEVYGFLGLYGSCKTTQTTMLCVEACFQCEKIYNETGENRSAFLISYEATEKELWIRSRAYAARIQKQGLERMRSPTDVAGLSTSESLKPYEQILFASLIASGAHVPGEQERLRKAEEVLDRYLIVLDMTGADQERPGAGAGYLPEVRDRIKAELQKRGKRARAQIVVLDYVGAMCDLHLMAMGMYTKSAEDLISQTPPLARQMIATQYR